MRDAIPEKRGNKAKTYIAMHKPWTLCPDKHAEREQMNLPSPHPSYIPAHQRYPIYSFNTTQHTVKPILNHTLLTTSNETLPYIQGEYYQNKVKTQNRKKKKPNHPPVFNTSKMYKYSFLQIFTFDNKTKHKNDKTKQKTEKIRKNFWKWWLGGRPVSRQGATPCKIHQIRILFNIIYVKRKKTRQNVPRKPKYYKNA